MRLNAMIVASMIAVSASLSACSSTPPAVADVPDSQFIGLAEASGVSQAAARTALRDGQGRVVGAAGYTTLDDAVMAGDTYAFLMKLKAMTPAELDEAPIYKAYLAIDRAADGDLDSARKLLSIRDENVADEDLSALAVYLDAWFYALEGNEDEAIARHRDVANGMPGLTGDLSLAAMLEAIGRPDQALAVYESMTPNEIIAPEHEFDPQGLMYSHIKTVVSRHALLLQRLGRIEEAKAVYQKLADAEPEEAISYAAAIESLETGKNLKNEALNVRSAFAQSLSDVSRALQEQRIIRMIMMGLYPQGFDGSRASFDQVALLVDPNDEGLRSVIIDELYENALFDGVAHVATTAPEATASLQLAAAQAYVMNDKPDLARAAVDKALEIADEDEHLQTLYGSLQMRTLLEDEAGAVDLVEQVVDIAENPAEEASAHALATEIYGQFGQTGKALKHARAAQKIDDTHNRRIALADALGKDGKVEEGLQILRNELLSRPNDPYTLNSLGYYFLIHTEKHDEAFKLLARARSMANRDPYIADSIGWAYFKLGHLDDAKRLILSAKKDLEPHGHWEIEGHLGDILWYQGDKDGARSAWERALEHRPPVNKKRELRDRLANGLTEPAPVEREVPDVSLEGGEIGRQDI